MFPRIPVPVLRSIVANLEKLKLPTKHAGVTGDTTRGSDDTARRPPSVKAALSVSFGQRAPHRTSTRDSSPVRRNIAPPPSYDRNDGEDSQRSPSRRRSQSCDLSDREYADRDRGRDRDRDSDRDRGRERERDRERERERDKDRDRDKYRDRKNDYDRRSRESSRKDYYRESSSRRSRSRSRSQSIHARGADYQPSSHRDEMKEKAPAPSNLEKLRGMYGDLKIQKEDAGNGRAQSRDNGADEVIRLGGSSWR